MAWRKIEMSGAVSFRKSEEVLISGGARLISNPEVAGNRLGGGQANSEWMFGNHMSV